MSILPKIGLLCLLPMPAFAQPRTAVLKVPGMTCPTCPLTLKKVLLAQPGCLR